MSMHKITTALFSLALALPAVAQNHEMHSADGGEMKHEGMHAMHHGSTDDQAAARAVVDALFDGMRAADSSAVAGVFASNARLMSTGNRNGTPMIQESSIAAFAGAVGKAQPNSWDERIWDVMIHVNGNLATAWMAYAFYHDGNFSHCGVNAFQIVKLEEGWKILQITDTRQREGCEIPDDVKNK